MSRLIRPRFPTHKDERVPDLCPYLRLETRVEVRITALSPEKRLARRGEATLPWGEGGARPAVSPAGAGRVRGYFRRQPKFLWLIKSLHGWFRLLNENRPQRSHVDRPHLIKSRYDESV